GRRIAGRARIGQAGVHAVGGAVSGARLFRVRRGAVGTRVRRAAVASRVGAAVRRGRCVAAADLGGRGGTDLLGRAAVPAGAAADQARIGRAAGTIVGGAGAAADSEIRYTHRLDASAEHGVGGRALGARAVQRPGTLAGGPVGITAAWRAVRHARHAGAG